MEYACNSVRSILTAEPSVGSGRRLGLLPGVPTTELVELTAVNVWNLTLPMVTPAWASGTGTPCDEPMANASRKMRLVSDTAATCLSCGNAGTKQAETQNEKSQPAIGRLNCHLRPQRSKQN